MSQKEIILFCVVKDELHRMQQFLPYYRNLGVTSFVFTDNNSTDGTYEFLQEQEGVTLYREKTKYSSILRNSWIVTMLNNHGRNKWCVVVDSDEFLSYVGQETHNLSDLISVAESNNYSVISGFMLDMYSELKMFSNGTFDMDYSNYFDSCGYKVVERSYCTFVQGGPRTRLFGTRQYVSKQPIFYYTDGIHYTNAHYMRVDDTNKISPILVVLRHYKFQTDMDRQKLDYAVANHVYYHNSRDYVPIYDYIRAHCIPTMYNYDISKKYISSKSLTCLDILQEPFNIESEDDTNGKS